jgi:tRNA(Ile2) C34 agmatinyltransferase TiaS
MEYVSSIKAAWDIAKAVKVSADAIDDSQIKLQVAELIGALADARIEAAESNELIASLKLQMKSKIQLEFDGHVYYRAIEGGKREGPWCPTCYDSKGMEVRLHESRGDTYRWRCKACGQVH